MIWFLSEKWDKKDEKPYNFRSKENWKIRYVYHYLRNSGKIQVNALYFILRIASTVHF